MFVWHRLPVEHRTSLPIYPAGVNTFPTQRGAPRGAERPAHRSPADEAVPGPALPKSLSIRHRIIAAGTNQAGDCSTAITVPVPARLHRRGSQLQRGHQNPGSAPDGVCAQPALPHSHHFSSLSHFKEAQPGYPNLSYHHSEFGYADMLPATCLCHNERANPACRVVQCTSVASSPYGRTCCILIYCLFG